MRFLIVNGDDLGVSPGVNRGILEAHRSGILTSASLMVDRPWSEKAAILGRGEHELSLGLHVELGGAAAAGEGRSELARQLARFVELVGRPPTHIDSHHNVHRKPALRTSFLELAQRCGVPMREDGLVRFVGDFYGQWGGESHPETIGISNLLQILETKVTEGVTELMCHPGYADPELRSSYTAEREIELLTLCDPALPEILRSREIRLVGFRDLPGLPIRRAAQGDEPGLPG